MKTNINLFKKNSNYEISAEDLSSLSSLDVKRIFYKAKKENVTLIFKHKDIRINHKEIGVELFDLMLESILITKAPYEKKEKERQKRIDLYPLEKYKRNNSIKKMLKKNRSYKQIQERLNVSSKTISKLNKKIKKKEQLQC